ncbi:neuralized-like protein 4 [Hetaerina americana]|uniref:neuralized-like protein 4 n=1 Tax=Hetaerina americana TaxID=62018 RepID=UPI003A7F1F26
MNAEHKLQLEVSLREESNGTWNIGIQKSSSSVLSLVSSLIAKGTGTINFKGQIQDPSPQDDKTEKKLLFHIRGGPLTAVSDYGLTAFAFGHVPVETWSVTNRTLQINELFEVELRSCVVEFKGKVANVSPQGSSQVVRYSNQIEYTSTSASEHVTFCIGVTSLDPSTFAENMKNRPDGWYWSGKQIYNDKMQKKYFGNVSPKIGDRVGLLQDASGNLHFFVNGVDHGTFSKKLPFPLYGCIQFDETIRTASLMDGIATYGYLLKINSEK